MDSLNVNAIQFSTAVNPAATSAGTTYAPGAAACRCCSSASTSAASPVMQQMLMMNQFMMVLLQLLMKLMAGGQAGAGGTGGGTNPVASASGSGGGSGSGGQVGSTGGAASPVGVQSASSSGSSIKGLDPVASDALRRAGLSEGDVSQGLGHAAASAGTHEAEPGSKYTGSVDIRTSGRSSSEIKKIVANLRAQGFAAWYRNWPGNQHIHAVYAGIPLKGSTSNQVQAFLKGGTGLASGGSDSSITAQQIATIRALYQNRSKRVTVQA